MKISKNCFRRWFFAYLSWRFWWFLKVYVSHGSVVTQLKCGKIFNNCFIVNCLQYVPVKKFRKSVNIWQRCEKWQSGTFFGTRCSLVVVMVHMVGIICHYIVCLLQTHHYNLLCWHCSVRYFTGLLLYTVCSTLSGWPQVNYFQDLECLWKWNRVLKVLEFNEIGSKNPSISAFQNHFDHDVEIIFIWCQNCLMQCREILREQFWKRYLKVVENSSTFLQSPGKSLLSWEVLESPKLWLPCSLVFISSPNIDRFWQFFTVTFCGEIAIRWLIDIPLHLKCVTALPCEM